MEEPQSERAISSEPCSGRPNPFDDVTEPPLRKRQRVSRKASRSISADGSMKSNSSPDETPILLEEIVSSEPDQTAPASICKSLKPLVEQVSNNVTINLRANHNLDSSPSLSPSYPEIMTPIRTSHDNHGTRRGVEPTSDDISTATSSSPPILVSSPHIEVLPLLETELEADPPIALLDDTDDYNDIFSNFPYRKDDEALSSTVHRLLRFFQFDEMVTNVVFFKLHNWINNYLMTITDADLFYENFTRNREFWELLPDVIWALSRRQKYFGDFLHRNLEDRQALTNFLCQFGRLTGRFLTNDLRTISSLASKTLDESNLGSRQYLHALSHLLHKDESPHIGKNLENHYDWNFDDDIIQICQGFQSNGGTIPSLKNFVEGQLRVLPLTTHTVEQLIHPCRIVQILICDAIIVSEEDHKFLNDEATIDAMEQTVLMGYEFFLVMSTGLESIIEKHPTSLSPDVATTYIHCLAYIFKSALTLDNKTTQSIFKEKEQILENISPLDYPTVISLGWKFKIFKSLMTSAQMQLRVTGVTTMCTELLQLHHSSRSSDTDPSPVLAHFANYILENKIIDYIVGVGSHPEIINESSSIIGFLIITKTLKPQQIDVLWQTVTTCQDLRIVDAILRMLSLCHNLLDEENLLYLCRKANDVSIESFSPAMREFCQALFKQFISKSSSENLVPAAPYQLCVRLIRETSKITDQNLASYVEIQIWAATRLRELLSSGPSPRDRLDIYQQCMKDISLKKSTVPGSICVIYTFLSSDGSEELLFLTTKYDLTRLFIDELESLIVGKRFSSFQLLKATPAAYAYRSLLLRIIKVAPTTITPDLGKRLWDALVGSESLSCIERSIWWQTLNIAVKQSQRNNIFLTNCFQNYLPNLSPNCFTPGALEFAREAVLNWLEDDHNKIIEDKTTFNSPALEQIWHMVLTATSNTIEGAAINILVEIYVQSSLIMSVPQEKAHQIHLDLVNRCLKQLEGAASKLKEYSNIESTNSSGDIVTVSSEDQFQIQEKIFARSLAVLKEFLQAYQLKPQLSNSIAEDVSSLDISNIPESDLITFKYQSFHGKNQTGVRNLILDRRNTVKSLLCSLHEVTGFKNFKIYSDGKEFVPDSQNITKPLVDLNLRGLLLVKYCDDVDNTSLNSPVFKKTTLELEIVKHFEDLWGYLSMHEKVAGEILNFLKSFPLYDHLLESLRSDTPYSEIFPAGQPCKSLYAIHGLREYIFPLTQKNKSVDEAMLFRAVSLLVATILDSAVLDDFTNNELKNTLSLQLIDCLIIFLRESSSSSISSLLDESLHKRLSEMLMDSLSSSLSQTSHVTSMLFEAIIECSIHSTRFWDVTLLYLKKSEILKEMLLENPQESIRKSTAKVILDKCTQYIDRFTQVPSLTLVTEFWPLIVSLVPVAVRQPEKCEQVLSVSYTLLKRIAETSIKSLRLEELVQEWGNLLISHSSHESINQIEKIDMVAQGLGRILHYATSVAESAQQSLSCSHIGTKLFRKHLFPEISCIKDTSSLPNIPLLNSKTRNILAETVFFLIKDDETEYCNVLLTMDSLLPYVTRQDRSPYSYDLSFLFERAKSIRSQTGYAGLRNPSNTCYLNSLLTQLYMNVPFRSFMLSALVVDGGASQKLLSETQSLFSYMQNSFKRFVDPEKFASSIRTYEETQIDVTVQMDVDEFYNLLFDRWESQILVPNEKDKFRSFYGGQLVQQVKSRECPHISERLEPFSAIQCDIKGKSCLQESLLAYVDGEVMDGENKYKCSTCDKHVEAVKRACLKEIPDNLIFHLKRFDFNLRTLQRNKINDHFSFPNKIDMNPYKVEHLLNNSKDMLEDIFELVGILVHSGTAESGHYYSYIRERPSSHPQEKWVEFNDECVSSWDPNSMEVSCFGGPDYRAHDENSSCLYDKTWSAYMLFYQRASVVNSPSFHSSEPTPIRLPISRQLSNMISTENEILMRKYCLYDSSHTSFTMKMLQNAKKIGGGNSDVTSQHLQKIALRVSFNHLDQVVTRAKDLPDFPTYMLQLRQLFQMCVESSRHYLEWICESREALCQLLFKNPEQLVRIEIASSIFLTLCKVRNDAPYAYGLLDFEESDDEQENGQPEILEKVITALNSLWDIFHTCSRAWPEYFGLLTSIARIGTPEATALLSTGYLHRTLDIITADPNLLLSSQYTKMLNTISKRNSIRPVAYGAIISLLWQMMRICDASLEPVDECEDRLELALNDGLIPFTVYERNLIVQYWTRSNSNILIEKLLHINQNEKAVEAILTELLNWDEDIDLQVRNAIASGIKRGSSSVSSRPFLRAAIIYCEHSKDPHGLQTMVVHITKVASRLANSEGKEFLQFFRHLLSLTGSFEFFDEDVRHFLLNQIPIWAPCLLTNFDHDVRQNTEEFIQEFVLSNFTDNEEKFISDFSDGEKYSFLRNVCQKLALRCLDFLLENYTKPRQTAVRGTLDNIQAVIEACEETFDEDSPSSRRYFEQRSSTIGILKKLIVDEADQEVSDWENLDGNYESSSEPMDGAIETDGVTSGEIQN
ncbi:putative ubiquitin hydrolase [Golovinomyces cichoracearum]|uniref:Putative ubiquitin hydrolase n=1 Tax=Golovinomyces cichoracearum TaxID=62708 RepID=A0A420I297_9PEZI|nr:putative ubiquitin hydrolase [Golovinomyces cichoracearum]